MKSVRPDYLKLYAVTDDGPNLIERVRCAIEGGATCIQHRAKCATFEAAKADALAILAVCREYGVPFIVNDSLELALAVGADGLHVGQDDVPAPEARRALGPDAILGVSAATVEDAIRAERDGADYIGTGAIFPTATKPDAACVTPSTLRAICESVSIPVVAIGGIHAGNVPALAHSGIAGVAVVSALFGAPDVAAAARELDAIVEHTDFSLPAGTTGFVLDFDGTILDSMGAWATLATDFLLANGVEPCPDLGKRLAGCPDLASGADVLRACHELPGTREDTFRGLLAMLETRCLACDLKPGVTEFLCEAKKRGFRPVVGTANDRGVVERVLAKHGLAASFEAILTTAEIGLGKDDPAFYRAALAVLGTAPAQTWLLDDDPAALTAARACDLRTAGIPDSGTPETAFAGADRILKRIDEWFLP